MDEDQLEAVRYVRLAANRENEGLTAAGFEDHPGPTRQTVCRRLDTTWNGAKRLAGLGPTREVNVPPERLREDVEQVRDKLGKKPSYQDYLVHGEHSPGPIRRRMGDGKWNNGLEALGLVPQWEQDVPEWRLRADVKGLAIKLDRTPTESDYKEQGRYAFMTVARKIALKWRDICREVGLEPNHRSKHAVHSKVLNQKVASSAEADFARGLDRIDMLKNTVYQPDSVSHEGRRWEPDFKVDSWLIECKQGSWGEYTQAEVMASHDGPVLVYGLKRDIESLPHDESIVRIPGEVPDLAEVFK